jgi:hypothetical protein
MFGFFAKLEQLADAIMELVAKLAGLSQRFDDIVESLNEEITDDFAIIQVEKVTLVTGETFMDVEIYGDNGLTYINAQDGVYVTTGDVTAKVKE